jgi:hypothetical protein
MLIMDFQVWIINTCASDPHGVVERAAPGELPMGLSAAVVYTTHRSCCVIVIFQRIPWDTLGDARE